jgi:hypothetical protein
VDAVTRLFAFDNVEFGQTVYISKVYEVIQEIDGVVGVSITKFARKDTWNASTPLPASGTLDFTDQPGELPIWTGFTVVLSLPSVPDGVKSNLVMKGGVTNG